MKSFLVGIHFAGLILLLFAQSNEIKVEHNMPRHLKPGEEALVQISLDKADVSGFAKFQMNVDQGLSVELVDGAGASFTFNNQLAKFIWMSLPSDSKLVMKVRIIADKNSSGNYEIDQRFSYIYDNERKNYDAPVHSIRVSEDAPDMALEEDSKPKTEGAYSSGISVNTWRKISPAGVNQWRVDLEIYHDGLSGFAKIEEFVPEGFTVIDLKSNGAVFNVDNEQIKYIWYDFPQIERVTVSYKMLPVLAMDGKTPVISGTFDFLDEEEKRSIPIGSSYGDELGVDEALAKTGESTQKPEPATQPASPSETPAEETAMQEEAKETSPPESKPKADPPADKPSSDSKPEKEKAAPPKEDPSEKAYTDANIVDVPKPEEGVHFRVQVAAGKNNLSKEVFAKMYSFPENLKLENHKGWFKYTSGHHELYKAARNDRERITAQYSKFQGPFVTAYNDGERITVQEALMITSQKWVP